MGGIGGPARNARQAYSSGPVGVISRSGGMTTEMSSTLTAAGLGQSTAVSIGGDAIIGSTYAELMPLFEADDETRAIVIYTEPGGRMEAQLAEYGPSLPVVAFMAGRFMDEMPGMSFGHAGTIVEGKEDTATEKIARLQAAGIAIAERIEDIPGPGAGADMSLFIDVEVDPTVAADPAHGGEAHRGLPGRHLRAERRRHAADRRAEPRRVRALPALHRRRAAGHRDGAQALRRRGAALTVTLTPLAAGDAEALRAIRREPAVAHWWDELEPDFPFEEPESTRFTIRHDGEIAGMVQYGEELEPKYRSASIDIFVAPAHQGQGVCTEAVRQVVDHLIRERGHHRITIDPAASNEAAIRCYSKAGFTPVGVMRLAERDADGRGWHDSLMMELVVEPE